MSRLAALCCGSWILLIASTVSVAHAANDVWDANGLIPPTGIWSTNANWVDNITPGNADTATFNLAAAYTVIFNTDPLAIQALTVTGTVPTFTSSVGDAWTLAVTSASGGQDVTISGSVLTLGTAGNPLHMTVGDNLTVNGGAVLNAFAGSQVNTLDLLLATVNGGGNGVVVVDGAGSQLNVTNGFNLAQNGNTGTLTYRNFARGTLSGTVNLAASSNAATAATLNVESIAVLNTDSLAVGNGGGAGTGTLNINGAFSGLTQSGASTLSVGTASACFGNINIGTTADGGTLTTGTGTMTINATGTVRVGSGTNDGTLNAKGDVTINGGTLTRRDGSIFDLATGKTFTIQNGGDANFNGDYATSDGATYLVTGAGSTWTNTESLSVGRFSGTGTLSIEAGGSVSTLDGFIGYDTGSTGTVTVTGAGSTWTNNSFSSFYVGYGGTGTLLIEAGGSVSSGFGSIAVTSGSTGTVTVTGAGSTWNNNSLSVGEEGTGTLLIEAGGSVSNGNGYIGYDTGSTGTVTVTGAGSTWNNSASVSVGGSGVSAGGVGTLTVETGGTVNFGAQLSLWDNGTVNLSGGTINVKSLTSSGGTFNFNSGTLAFTGVSGLVIGGGGPFGSSLTLTAGQTVSVVNTTTIDNGSSLTLNGGTLNVASLAGGGAIILHAGTLNLTSANLTVGVGSIFGTTMFVVSAQAVNVTNQATIDAGAELVVAGSFSSSGLTNSGDLVAIDATMDGPVVNNNAITVVGAVDFNGLVSGPGDFFGPGTANFNGGMAPGASPAEVNFEGSLALADANTLFIEIAGIMPGSDYDRLTIAGSASLDGILDVSLTGGFMPSGGQQFTILTAGSIVNNGFVLAGSAASSFDLLVSSTSVILQAIGAGVPGDYNGDGIVNAADYVVWRNTFGQTGPGLAADGNNSGTIDADDYTVWRSHFGQTAGAGSVLGATGSASASAVPEPNAVLLALVGALVLRSMDRRRRTRPAN
jgi:T5SS/PEP-CTERM-associated repeat protein